MTSEDDVQLTFWSYCQEQMQFKEKEGEEEEKKKKKKMMVCEYCGYAPWVCGRLKQGNLSQNVSFIVCDSIKYCSKQPSYFSYCNILCEGTN
jgi:hypothetical protein